MAKSKFPPLLHLSYILQQSAEEMLESQAGVGLSAARIMSGVGQRPVASIGSMP